MLKKKFVVVSILLLVVISQLGFVNEQVNGIRWPMEPAIDIHKYFVYHVINDSYVDQVNEAPQINIHSFSHVVLTGRIALQLMQPPILNSSYEYRMLVFWDTRVWLEYNLSWPNPDWENVIPPKTNFTLCVAGGASWLDVTNGSYSAYYNGKGDLVFNESKSNSVKTVDAQLQFPIKQDFIPDRYYAETVQVFTLYNATSSDVNATQTELYLDGLPRGLVEILLDCVPEYFIGPIVPGFTFFSSLFIFVIVVVRRRKTK